MKRVQKIQVSGVYFNMDEDAYEHLKKYLNTLSAHFEKEEGGKEIVSDVENRVAELFQQRLQRNKEVISITDVKEVIGQLGTPKDFGASTSNSTETTEAEYSGVKRIYRDTDSRVIGGVCGGLGWYFGIDPVIIRVIFLVLLLIFGTGTLLYIILWIAVPEANTPARRMEMMGKPVTLDTIEKNIKREVNDVKKKMGL